MSVGEASTVEADGEAVTAGTIAVVSMAWASVGRIKGGGEEAVVVATLPVPALPELPFPGLPFPGLGAGGGLPSNLNCTAGAGPVVKGGGLSADWARVNTMRYEAGPPSDEGSPVTAST
jgi:hypothetical protein